MSNDTSDTQQPSSNPSSVASSTEGSVKKLGVVGATFLIISSLAGSGVIALPQQLAFTGSITLVSFILVTLGAFFLTLVYVKAGDRFDDPSPHGTGHQRQPGHGCHLRGVLCLRQPDF